MNKEDIEKILKAGKISAEVKNYARSFIKKDMPFLEIVEKIESKISDLGARPGFPVNLDVDEVAAHYHPSYNDEQVARGLMKVDIGISVDGWVADSAFSMDLEGTEENKKLIQATQEAINKIEETLVSSKPGTITAGQIGSIAQKTAESFGVTPVSNLYGHQIKQYELHAGINIPCFANNSTNKLSEGYYAIEPFFTTGNGKVKDGAASNIYSLTSERKPRHQGAREILKYIIEEYESLPFASRWLVKKFGVKALFALKQLEANGNVHSYPQLIESTGKKVAQREQDFLVTDKEVIMTTKED